jgi:hypothetical protein
MGRLLAFPGVTARDLKLDELRKERLPASREGTRLHHVLVTLCAYRLIDPGSEWRLDWGCLSAAHSLNLLGEDFSLVAKDNLYRCQDKLLAHKEARFSFLKERWEGLFGVSFEVLLYHLPARILKSTRIDASENPEDKRRHGYSRAKRPDCA